MNRIARGICCPLIVLLCASPVARAAMVPCEGERWIGAWAASPSDALGFTPVLAEQTLRMVIHPLFGGSRLRVRLSNRFGTDPVTLGAVSVGRRAVGAALVPDANRGVTFAGETEVTIAPGTDATSDPVDLAFGAFQDLAVSVYVPGVVRAPTEHFITRQTSYLSPAATGDHTADVDGAAFAQPARAAFSNGWFFLTGMDVLAPASNGAVVAFGDSITDGFQGLAGAVVENPTDLDANTRYPDLLAHRLAGSHRELSVLNQGISGNKVLADADPPLPFGPKALDRLDEDALALPGVTDVIVLEGINDLGGGATAADVIEGLSQIVARIRGSGLRAHLGTLTPSGGALPPDEYGSAETNARREAVNEWIRTWSEADSVVDFDAAVRDPADPSRLRAEFDSSDHLHPNSAGYAAMADAVDLAALRGPACAAD